MLPGLRHDDVRKGKVVRFQRNVLDLLFFEGDPAHDGIASKLGEEAVVVAAAVAEPVVSRIERDQRNDDGAHFPRCSGHAVFEGWVVRLDRLCRVLEEGARSSVVGNVPERHQRVAIGRCLHHHGKRASPSPLPCLGYESGKVDFASQSVVHGDPSAGT